MKELNIYIVEEDLPKVTDTLRKHNVAGMGFSEIQGAGHMKRREIRERNGWEVRTVTPEYEKRTKVATIVTDSSVERIVEDLTNAYEIGTKQSGDTLLTQASQPGQPLID